MKKIQQMLLAVAACGILVTSTGCMISLFSTHPSKDDGEKEKMEKKLDNLEQRLDRLEKERSEDGQK